MMRTHTLMKSNMVTGPNGEATFEPVYASQEMVYRDNGSTFRFSYDTNTSSEADVDAELAAFDPFIATLFAGAVSLFARELWKKGRL